MGTATTNYGLDKPTIGGDNDNWGNEGPGTGLNENMNIIDAQMKQNADDILLQVPLDGSRPMTGELTLPVAAPTGDAIAANKKYVDDLFVGFLSQTEADARYLALDPQGPLIGELQIQVDSNEGHLKLSQATLTDAVFFVHSPSDTLRLAYGGGGSTGGVTAAQFDPAGPAASTEQSVITKEKGDALYVSVDNSASPIVAWATLDGATGATIRGSGLTATKLSAGVYEVTLIDALADSNYMVQLSAQPSSAQRVFAVVSDTPAKTNRVFRVHTMDVNGTPIDFIELYVQVVH